MAIVVISHDCDLAQSHVKRSRSVEVIVGQVASQRPTRNYTHAKNSRRLHLEIRASVGQRRILDIQAQDEDGDKKDRACRTRPQSQCRDQAGRSLGAPEVARGALSSAPPSPDEFERRLTDIGLTINGLRKIFESLWETALSRGFLHERRCRRRSQVRKGPERTVTCLANRPSLQHRG